MEQNIIRPVLVQGAYLSQYCTITGATWVREWPESDSDIKILFTSQIMPQERQELESLDLDFEGRYPSRVLHKTSPSSL